MVIPEWFYATSVIASFGAGFAVGKYLAPKNVVVDEGYCRVPIKSGGDFSTPIRKIYTNGKCTDVTCSYLGKKRTCEFSGDICQYLA